MELFIGLPVSSLNAEISDCVEARRMAGRANLGALEQQIMLAILRLHPDGYGVSIRDELERRTGRCPSFGSIYAALERLEAKGYVASRQGEPTAERGGRRKVYFTLTAPGQVALRNALDAIDALRNGLTEEAQACLA